MILNNFFHFNFLNYYVSMPMEKKGQCVRLSAISQVRRTCRAPGLVTRGQKECQEPVWSPGGQSPYEYIKEYCNPTCMWHVNYLRSFPTVLLNQFRNQGSAGVRAPPWPCLPLDIGKAFKEGGGAV